LTKTKHHCYDVAIVGSGPAGSLLAYELARAGRSVVLLEKKKLPRYKACGGGLTRRALNLIPFSLEPLIEDRAHTIRLRVHYRTVFAQTRPDPAVHLVMRSHLDHFLAQQAAAAGAVLRDRTRFLRVGGAPGRLTIQTTAGSLRARLIVGADGVHSRTARAIGLPLAYRVMPALEAELAVPETTLKRFAGSIHFDFGVIPGGYAWIFPKNNHISAGILARRRPAKDLKPFLRHYLEANGLPAGNTIRPIRLHPIPCRPDRRNRYANERGLIIGDGTGLVDPVTGEGIFYALQTARIAARAIQKGSPDAASIGDRYNRRLKQDIEAETLKADLLARLLYRCPAWSNRILERYGDTIGAKHIAVYLGQMTYHQLYRYILSPRGLAFLLRQRRKPHSLA